MDKKELIYESPRMATYEITLRKVIALSNISGDNDGMKVDAEEDWDD